MTVVHTNQHFELWDANHTWQQFDIVGESNYLPAIRRAWSCGQKDEFDAVRVDLELVPEPDNPYDHHAISVRASGRVVGYFSRQTNPEWWPVIARVAASGLIATAPGRVWYRKSGQYENGSVQLGIGRPGLSLPLNSPPERPHTMLPTGSMVQVTKESDHFDVLGDYVPPSGHGALYLTLHRQEIVTSRSRRVVAEVRLDGERVGQLTKATSEKFLPAIEHNADRGLVTAVRGEIKGSGVAAELILRAAKAHELDEDALDGPAVRLPDLVAFDPKAHYDVPDAYGQTSTSMRLRATRQEKQAATGADAAPIRPVISPMALESTFAQPPKPHTRKTSQVGGIPTEAPRPQAIPAYPAPPPLPPAALSGTRGAISSRDLQPPKQRSTKPVLRGIGMGAAALLAAFILGVFVAFASPAVGGIIWLLGIPAAVGVGVWSLRKSKLNGTSNIDAAPDVDGPTESKLRRRPGADVDEES